MLSALCRNMMRPREKVFPTVLSRRQISNKKNQRQKSNKKNQQQKSNEKETSSGKKIQSCMDMQPNAVVAFPEQEPHDNGDAFEVHEMPEKKQDGFLTEVSCWMISLF